MAYGTVTARSIRLGHEGATPGTAVPATVIWEGPGAQIDPGLVVVRPKINVGLRVPSISSYVPYKMATLDFPETEATFEQILYLLTAGAKQVMTGIADGTTGTGKIYDFPVSETGGDAYETYTIEAGDNNAAAEMEYSFPLSFDFTWAPQQGLMMSSKWVGRQRTDANFTALTRQTVEQILAPSIFVHDTTIGSGQIQGTLIGYKFTYNTGLYPLVTGDGQLFFHAVVAKEPSGVLSLTYEHDANATAEYAKFVAQTKRVVRIQHEGSALTKGDGAYSKKTFLIDLCGKYTSFPPFGDTDGDDVITCDIEAGYDATADLFIRFLDVCTLAAVV